MMTLSGKSLQWLTKDILYSHKVGLGLFMISWMYYYFNKCMMVFVVPWMCEKQSLVWRASALLLKLRFNNQSESEHPPGINEAPEAAPILWGKSDP